MKRYFVLLNAVLFSLLFLALFLASCNDNPVSPGVGLEVRNSADDFQYQVSSMKSYTRNVYYTWNNSGSSATINQACAVTGGTAILEIYDADEVQVYSHDLAENGTMTATSGTAGAWTIRILFQKTSGTINFRVQKL
jgi:hypothetical protein